MSGIERRDDGWYVSGRRLRDAYNRLYYGTGTQQDLDDYRAYYTHRAMAGLPIVAAQAAMAEKERWYRLCGRGRAGESLLQRLQDKPV